MIQVDHQRFLETFKMKLQKNGLFKSISFAGWAMQMSRFLYISRKWEKDEGRLEKLVEYLGRHCKGYQIVLFPEGTNWTPQTVKKSRAFEEANNLKGLNWVLQPRTTGFTSLVQQMRERK